MKDLNEFKEFWIAFYVILAIVIIIVFGELIIVGLIYVSFFLSHIFSGITIIVILLFLIWLEQRRKTNE